MRLDRPVRQFWPSSIVVAFGLLGALEPAHSECLSPSAASGATATTVFRCVDQPGTARQEQPAVSTEKTTVVERGPADVPWFVPKTAENAMEPVKAPPAQAARVEEKIEKKPEKKLSVTKKTTRKKLVKLKPAKTKTTKALTAKPKPVKRMSKTQTKVASEKPDDNTVVWTRKDVPVGNRIVNWLGL